MFQDWNICVKLLDETYYTLHVDPLRKGINKGDSDQNSLSELQ